MIRWGAFLFLLLAMGCGQDTSGTRGEAVCAPGLVESCPCVGGGAGVQACLEDGSGWGMCECPDDSDKDMTSKPTDMSQDMPPQMDMDDDDDDDDDDDKDMSEDMTSPGDMTGCTAPEMTQERKDRAQMLYTTYCASCHGAMGQGTAIGPAILEDVAKDPNEEIVEVILEGEDNMPPIAVSPTDANEIVWHMLGLAEAAGYDTSERCEEDDDD